MCGELIEIGEESEHELASDHEDDVVVADEGGDDLGVELVGLLDGGLGARAAAHVGAQREYGRGAHLRHRVAHQRHERRVHIVAHALPARLRIRLPAQAEADAHPLAEERVAVVLAPLHGEQVGAHGDEVVLLCALLAARIRVDEARQHEHRVHLVGGVHVRIAERLDEVDEALLVLDKLGLARPIDGQYLGPDEGEERPELARLRRQQLEHVGKDADGEGGRDGPRSEVEELAEQLERLHAMLLAEEHLQDDGQLLGWRVRVDVVAQPDVEDLDLLGEEAARDEVARLHRLPHHHLLLLLLLVC